MPVFDASHLLNEQVLNRLPLPLAQLARRASNTTSALHRQQTAYCLWEAGLKLLCSVAVVEYAEHPELRAAELESSLRNLAHPSLGHWWELTRRLVPVLAGTDPGFRAVRDLLLGKARDDLPRAAGLDALLIDLKSGGPTASRTTVRLAELFDRLANFRNRETGHGAPGQRPDAVYERLAPAMLAGILQVYSTLDVLAGRRLIYVAELRGLRQGGFVAERYELTGPNARRIESIEYGPDDPARPRPERVYVESEGAQRATYPLINFLLEGERAFFLNAQGKNKRTIECLCYSTGELLKDDFHADHRELLARALDVAVDESTFGAWAARSQADQIAAAEPEPGARRALGEFELMSELGRGGMGIVYRAWQPSLGRQVAVKKMAASTDPKAEIRFLREIRTLGRVDHPNVVKVYTSGAIGDDWFFAMELIEGANLGEVCATLARREASTVDDACWFQAVTSVGAKARRSEKLLSEGGAAQPPVTAEPAPSAPAPVTAGGSGREYVLRMVRLMRDVARAAHALHESGVIHRDIKPSNIMVTADGETPVLMDLGLAQILDESEGRITRTRQFVGTVRYASPEQVMAVSKLDATSDVYSLGATLWELLALKPMFGATDETPVPQLMMRVQQEEPERLRKRNPAVSRDLEALVRKCLEKRSERRYTSAEELAADLGRWLNGQPVLAQPPSFGYLLGKHLRRHKWSIAIAAVGLFAVVAGLVAAGTSAALVRIDRARREAEDARGSAVTSLEEARVARETAEAALRGEREAKLAAERSFQAEQAAKRSEASLRERLAYGLAVDLAHREWKGGNVAHARALLVGCPREWRGWEWGYVWQLLPAEPNTIRKSQEGEIALAVVAGPDRTWVIVLNQERVIVREAINDQVVSRLPAKPSSIRCGGFNPSGSRVATVSDDGTVHLTDTRSGMQLASWKLPTDDGAAVAVSADGKTIATAGAGRVRLWDAQTGAETGLVNGDLEGEINAVAFSPDGYWLGAGGDIKMTRGDDKITRVWNARTGAEQRTFHHSTPITTLAFSPDASHVVTAGPRHGIRVWEVATGEELVTVSAQFDQGVSVAYQADGRHVVTAGQTGGAVRNWYIGTGGPVTVLRGHTGPVLAARFSSDGHSAVTAGYDGTARVWDVRSGRLTRLLADHPPSWLSRAIFDGATPDPAVTAVAFDPTGRSVVTGRVDRTAVVWDVESGQKRWTVSGHTDWVTAANFRSDGLRLLTASGDGTARVWDTAIGTSVLGTLRGHSATVYAASFSRDGNKLLTASGDGTARVWSASDGGEDLVLRGHEGDVRSAAFDTEANRVVTAGWDGTARVWNAHTGAGIAVLRGHAGRVWSAAFSPDGTRIATAGADGTVRIWDAANGNELFVIRAHTGHVWSVTFSPDGRQLLSAGADGTAKVWQAAAPDADKAR